MALRIKLTCSGDRSRKILKQQLNSMPDQLIQTAVSERCGTNLTLSIPDRALYKEQPCAIAVHPFSRTAYTSSAVKAAAARHSPGNL